MSALLAGYALIVIVLYVFVGFVVGSTWDMTAPGRTQGPSTVLVLIWPALLVDLLRQRRAGGWRSEAWESYLDRRFKERAE